MIFILIILRLLLLVFAFIHPFQNGEAGFFCIGNGKRFQFYGRVEGRKNFAHGLFTSRTFRQFRRARRAAQGEFSFADHAGSFAQLILVKRHDLASETPARSQIFLRSRDRKRNARTTKKRCKPSSARAIHCSNFTEASAATKLFAENHFRTSGPINQQAPMDGNTHKIDNTKYKTALEMGTGDSLPFCLAALVSSSLIAQFSRLFSHPPIHALQSGAILVRAGHPFFQQIEMWRESFQ